MAHILYTPLLSRLVGQFGLKVLKHLVLDKGSFWQKISVKGPLQKDFLSDLDPKLGALPPSRKGGRGEGGTHLLAKGYQILG